MDYKVATHVSIKTVIEKYLIKAIIISRLFNYSIKLVKMVHSPPRFFIFLRKP